MEFTLPGPDGRRRWYEATGRPGGDAGRTGDAVLVIRDITDRTLRTLQDQFLALASHELRTPLTALLGSLELLITRLRKESDSPRLGALAGTALEAGQRLQRLIDDLVDVSRLANGKLRLIVAPTDLALVTSEAVAAARSLAAERPVRLEGADAPLLVLGDALRLEQVLLNLLTNAFTHAPGSPVEITVRRVDGEAQVRVSDHGPGIAPDALPNLFSRFYQGAGTQPRSFGGMGLGLYIAREIAEAHGGSIEVQSALGEGAAFTVHLPILAEPGVHA